uniref:B30.2/SPRY domain-containing protein n=1 Tax=Hucho hucho TaxID=62062 RepID=A0A4W5LGU8_9TELE
MLTALLGLFQSITCFSYSVDHGGECRLKSGLRKYACHLTLDPNTAHPNLILSEGNRKVTLVEENQHYEDHPDRFDCSPKVQNPSLFNCRYHVLCREGLSGYRYYWEVEWDGDMAVNGVLNKGMKRKEEMSCFLHCSRGSLFYHNGTFMCNSGPVPNRVGVYLDWPAGTLSFYSVSSSGTLTHLNSDQTRFTEPLYPMFGVSSSVTLCQIDDQHIQR